MSGRLFASYLILVLTAAVLTYAALTDLRHYRIRNDLIFAIGGLYLLHAVASGRWVEMHWNIGFALLMLGAMLPFYAKHWMGGGDVKILAVAFLWTGLSCALPFAILLAIFSGLHAGAARLGWIKADPDHGTPQRIAFAPSVAGALIGIFMLGCVEAVG